MSIYKLSIFSLLILVIAFSSCDTKNPYDTGPAYDIEGNLAKDSLLIAAYLKTAEIDSLYRIYDPSGVVIIVQKEGSGSRPITGNAVFTRYIGSLMSDGSVFDTNIQQVAIDNGLFVEGKKYDLLSFSLGAGTVIQGWDIGFRRLRSGSKAQLIIPSTYAYRDAANNDRIPANSILIFEVDFKGME
ncbi:FKBP-type peptidyl-prolyl cis-trans isomerase FkpA [Algoriphagus ratkowskyi]|uniref:Peptidyl-prolyl cis-trans isomerase n=1 Tax=Algoriphagus ratkowskyi TaxID=57028 RepID=A0A2W7R1J1_9BACT|nr:FKBP-type peptidyl-prolyl cis-trans isomerase [Algoriphagus ratkowskyi]PZX54703.1 FKBP-type peptidyl-prolyl cis-trans isomerase FkpA [Algoriphagus ratkowskyi]TXD77012.1 FKBP-type peptidylprolyl isomerase [Algoriphagus ratkowskyi]